MASALNVNEALWPRVSREFGVRIESEDDGMLALRTDAAREGPAAGDA